MKKLKYKLLLSLFLLTITGKSQTITPENEYFTGIWEYHNNNTIFRLILWEDNEHQPYYNGNYYITGHYEMAEISGTNETLVYTSNPSNLPNNQKPPWILSGTFHDGIISGLFKEAHNGGSWLNGSFTITPLLPDCEVCPPKIQFTLKKLQGLNVIIDENLPQDFVIPKDIVLVKNQ